jgi:transcriptional regulator with XRE-family HTH domain
MRFSAKLRNFRQQYDLSRDQLAAVLGISPARIFGLENSLVSPKGAEVEEIQSSLASYASRHTSRTWAMNEQAAQKAAHHRIVSDLARGLEHLRRR